MVQRKRAVFFWRGMAILLILLVVGGLAYGLAQLSSGAWALFPTQTPTATFTPTPIIPTSTLYVPSDTPTVTPTPTRSSSITYTVVSGDTLIGIAANFGVEVDALAAYNESQNNPISGFLSVGQTIIIPPPGYTYTAPTATPLPTGLRPGTIITYTIRASDVLSVIAEQFGARLSDVMVINGITDANSIQVGEVIKIPYNSLTGTPVTPTRTPKPSATKKP